MNISHQVDVVVATGTLPDAELVEDEWGPEQVDVSPDPRRRIIILAATKQAGLEEARARGFEPVAVVTPRSLHAARGRTADEIITSGGLTAEQAAELLPHVLPALATTRGPEAQKNPETA